MRSELQIDLTNLPSQGFHISYDQSFKELHEKLKPLVGENKYQIKISIRPLSSSTYSISGSIQTQLNLLCSRCACDFKESIHKHFEEKIILQKTPERIDKTTRNNHFSELLNTDDFTVIHKPLFNVGDFLHELIAVEEPLRPLGKKECDNPLFLCENLEKMKGEIKRKNQCQVHFS